MTHQTRWTKRAGAAVMALALALPLAATACDTSAGSRQASTEVMPDSVNSDSVLVLPGEPTAPVQSIALTSHYDPSYSTVVYELVRLDGESDTPVWRTPPLGSEAYNSQLATDGSRALIALQDKVYAFDLVSGVPVWEAKLTDVFRAGCENCFEVVGSHLIVRSFDSVIHSIDTNTGAIDWSHRLGEPTGGFRVASSRVLLLDGTWDAPKNVIVDPATGAEIASLDIGCSEDEAGDYGRPLTDDAVVLPSKDDPDSSYIGFGIIPACWQKWNLATGTLGWDTVLPDDYLDSGMVAVLAEPRLTFSTRRPSLVQLDTTSGAGAAIPVPKDMEITPIAIDGDRLIARAVSTRGTPKWSIVALDARSGTIEWSVSLDEATPADEFGGSTVSSGQSVFIEHVDGDQIRLVLFDGDLGLSTQTISLVDGSTAAAAPVAFSTDETFPSLAEIAWRGPSAVIVTYDHLLVIDTNTATVTWSY